MTKGNRVKIRDLKPGDRFYKASDKNRLVWELVEGEMKKTHFRHYHYFSKLDTHIKPQPVDGNTAVVFLRSTNEQTIQNEHRTN